MIGRNQGIASAPPNSAHEHLRAYYRTLFRRWGQQHWWPGQTRLEVIVGAYLTQNTAWTNVEKALLQLRAAGKLTLDGIRSTPQSELEAMIRSSGYFRQKAQRLKAFVAFLDERYAGSLTRMLAQTTNKLRAELLALNGVGPETADSILLYAGQHPVFVVDAYTRRILDRHGILPVNAPYDEIRLLAEQALIPLAETAKFLPSKAKGTASGTLKSAMPKTVLAMKGAPGTSHSPSRMSMAKRSALAQVYNEMHGLMVGVGKNYCAKSNPKCDLCPLHKFLQRRKSQS
jgi:endonuclease III related protein